MPAGWEVWHVVTTRLLTEEVREEETDKVKIIMDQMVENFQKHVLSSYLRKEAPNEYFSGYFLFGTSL